MKLYLSSYRIPVPNELFALLPKPPTECKVALIPNAKDYNLPEVRAQKLDELVAYICGWGFRCDVIDLRDYDDPAMLQSELQPYDMLWVAGGNTFMLRDELHRCGIDTLIPELLASGMVYCGESAGAIVAGSSLRGFEVADDPELADKLLFDGMCLVDKVIAPHMDSPDYVEYQQHIKKLYGISDQIVYLNDNQALVVNGDDQKVVTGS